MRRPAVLLALLVAFEAIVVVGRAPRLPEYRATAVETLALEKLRQRPAV